MDEREFIFQLRLVVNSQRAITSDLSDALNEMETRVSNALATSKEITDLQRMMGDVEAGVEFLDVEDLQEWNADEATLRKIYEKRRDRFSDGIQSLRFINWQQFVRDSKIYCTQ